MRRIDGNSRIIDAGRYHGGFECRYSERVRNSYQRGFGYTNRIECTVGTCTAGGRSSGIIGGSDSVTTGNTSSTDCTWEFEEIAWSWTESAAYGAVNLPL